MLLPRVVHAMGTIEEVPFASLGRLRDNCLNGELRSLCLVVSWGVVQRIERGACRPRSLPDPRKEQRRQIRKWT